MIKSYAYNHQTNTLAYDINLEQKDEILQDANNLLWVDVYDCTYQELSYIGRAFDFHPLAIEDCLSLSPRAKVDKYNNYYFFVFHALRYNEESDTEITTDELDVFLGENFIVTIHKSSLPTVKRVARQCEHGTTKLMQRGPDYLLYSIVDGIVDEYFPILDRIGVRIDELEDEIYVNPAKEITDEILALKRTILLLRKTVVPQVRIFSNVNGRYSFKIQDDNKPYYTDLVDHLARITDTTDTYRDLVNSALDAYYSIVSNKTNEVIRVLTIISTITLPLTFFTGLFGMNVPIPFQTHPASFWGILAGMFGLIAVMLWYFRSKRWI